MSDLITSIEAGRTRSWVDPIGARELSSLVQRELHRKFDAIQARGGKVFFITTTYDPAPYLPDGVAWRDASDSDRLTASEACWDAMTKGRHVHHFFKALELATGLDLSGRWWAKREFTQNGFLHHHIILDGPDFLPYEHVNNCWTHGRVDCEVARSHGGLAWYVGKYCTKYGDPPPAWVYARPCGSLRFTTCSDGFWSDLHGTVPAARPVRRVACRTAGRSDRAEDKAFGCYETVGDRIARKARSVTVRCNGEREEVQGITLEEFRLHRDRSYEKSVIKARASMDAIVGLPMSQALRECRFIASRLRAADPPGVSGAVSVSDAGPQSGVMSCGSVRGPRSLPASLSGLSACGGEKTLPGRDPAAGGIAAASCVQLRLFPAVHDACHGLGAGAVGPAVTASRSDRCVTEPSHMARGLLTLSSPQECIKREPVQAGVSRRGRPPDIQS